MNQRLYPISALVLLVSSVVAEPLMLARDGTTDYVVVPPAVPNTVDEYAVNVLTNFLFQKTGASFAVMPPDKVTASDGHIFVGLSAPVLKAIGANPLAELQDQEYVVRSVDENIFLYGKGVHGNLYAVVDFMENTLGWRWYSVFEKPVVSLSSTLALEPFNRKGGFSFSSREVGLRWNYDFYYLNGMNMGSEKWKKENGSGFVPYLRNDKFVHGSFYYIPPVPASSQSEMLEGLTCTNYFEAHPDFFSMDIRGKRVNLQLCFGNPALRKELTANVLKHLALAPDNQIITIDAADSPGIFCYCPVCKALEEKYQGNSGPIIDYLIELCAVLKKEHPRVFVKTLAYRRSQTQKPPVLSEGEKLPDNLIISFAPIEDNYFADWTHPDPQIQETYRDLTGWGKITTHLWAWLYPNPWGTGEVMPVGNLQRNINNMRLMHKAGVTGIFTDHCGFLQRAGLSEIQSYLLYKLMRDIDCDTDAIIKEFTDHQYGAAAPLARQYLAALEKGRQGMIALPQGVSYRSNNFDTHTFPYLTVENIHRWQTWFDQMEAQVADQADRLVNVQVLRRELDFATLWMWFELKKAYPETFTDHETYSARITAANGATAPAGMKAKALGISAMSDFLAVIQGGGKTKALPEQFAEIDPNLVKQFIPRNYARSEPKTVLDPDAASGYAATVDKPDLPFQVGFYQWISRDPGKGTHGARVRIENEQITPGVYKLYELGNVVITPDSWIWFSAKSWGTHLEVGTRLYEPGEDNKWMAYVSMKFDGPSYSGTAETDQVLVDRIILVKQGVVE